MIQQLLTIGRNTFIESIRQPIFAVLLLVATFLLILNPAISAYTLDDDNKQLVDMGLSTLFISGLLLAAFTATGILSQEVENKTVLTVISKPISRPVFVLGKYLGTSFAIAIAYWALSLIFLLTVRHKVLQIASQEFDSPVLTFGIIAGVLALLLATLGNYFYHWVFTSSFVLGFAIFETLAWIMVLLINKDWAFQPPTTDLDRQLLLGLLLIFQGLLLLTAVAIALSTRLGQIMTLVACTGIFLWGLVNDYLLGRIAHRSHLADLAYRIVPNLQLYWPADALTQGHDFSGGYIALVTSYTALMITAVLAVAIALFQTREVG